MPFPELEAAVALATEELQDATGAYIADPSEEALALVRAKATTKQRAIAALAAARAEAAATRTSSTGARPLVRLTATSKESVHVSAAVGANIQSIASSVGWSVDGVTYNLIDGSNFTEIPATWVPTQDCHVAVQPKVCGG